MIAGAVGQFVAVPADILKIRMQSMRSSQLAWESVKETVRVDGVVRGLWRGAWPAVQRAALVNLGELATYDQAKRAILKSRIVGENENVWVHALSSLASGFCASVVSTPADVIKTRVGVHSFSLCASHNLLIIVHRR